MEKNEELVVTTSTLEETFQELREEGPMYRIILDSFDSADAMLTKLAELRKAAGLTQRELADLTGIRQPQLARYEKCNEYPRLDIFIRIADALKFNVIFQKQASKKAKDKSGAAEDHKYVR